MLEDLVVWYLFLGGAGAGLLFSTAVLECISPQATDRIRAARNHRYVPKEAYARFFGPAYGIGVAVTALGMLCLLLDIGRVDRALFLFFQPVPSFITVGAFALPVLIMLAAVLFTVWKFGVPSLPKIAALVVRVCCIVAALVVMVYTGLFLQSMPSVPLWVTPWLPVLFVASALSTGLALLMGTIILTGSGEEFKSTLRRVQKIDAIIIVCELIALALFVVSGLLGSDTARMSAEQLVQGDVAQVFWGCVIILGLAAPLVLDAANRAMNSYAALAASGLVLVGGFFLRWCVARAGMSPDIVTSVMGVLGIQ